MLPASSNSHNKLTDAGANLIRYFEGCHRSVGEGRYRAQLCPAGTLTIGYGHTNASGREITPNTVWAHEQCLMVFGEDMKKYEDTIRRLVKMPLSPYQFDAMVSFAFNVGEGNLLKSALLKKINTADWDGAAQEFTRWSKGGGQEFSGLVRRRAIEALLFRNFPDKNYADKAELVIKPINDMAQSVDNPDGDET